MRCVEFVYTFDATELFNVCITEVYLTGSFRFIISKIFLLIEVFYKNLSLLSFPCIVYRSKEKKILTRHYLC